MLSFLHNERTLCTKRVRAFICRTSFVDTLSLFHDPLKNFLFKREGKREENLRLRHVGKRGGLHLLARTMPRRWTIYWGVGGLKFGGLPRQPETFIKKV